MSIRTQLYLFFVVLPLLLTTACQSGQLVVTSSPNEADVYLTEDGGARTALGKTPLKIDSKVLSSASTDNIRLEVEKDGYHAKSVLLPTPFLPSEFSYSAKLSEVSVPQKCKDINSSLNALAEGIAESQSFIASRNFSMAESRLMRLVVEFPNVSVVYGLLGNVYYLQKDLKRAYDNYIKAFSLNPDNPRTETMVNKLRSLGVDRLPAGGGQE